MTRACLGVLAGMYALQLSSFAETSDYLTPVFVAAVFLFLMRQRLLLCAFVAGAYFFMFAAEQLSNSRIPNEIEGDSIVTTIRVIGFPERKENTVSFAAITFGDARLPEKVRLSWFDPPVSLRNGDNWHLEVRLRRPRGNSNPGGFDYAGWLFREHIAAAGYVVNSHRNQLLRATPMSPVEKLRMRTVQRISDLIDDPDSASVLLAVVVGARHEISRDQWDRYAATGTSHLMAISGLHVGLCALGAYYFMRVISGLFGFTGRTRNYHLAAVLFSLLVAILYVQVSGLAIPARRASAMLLLGVVYLLSRQQPDARRIVVVVALGIAIADPLSTMAPGFILSFAAVALLLWSLQCRRTGLPVLQVCLLMGLMPLTALLFDRISFAALPINLLAVPLFSLVTVPLALIGALCDGLAQPIGDKALVVAAHSVSLLERLIVATAERSWSSLLLPAFSGLAVIYLWLPAVWAILPARWPGREVAWLGIAGICLYQPRPPDPGCAVISVLDVGQGLAVAIQTNTHAVLYDTGPAYRNGSSAAETVVIPFLRSRGIGELDQLVVSHADLDHAGGVTAISAAMPVYKTIAGEAMAGAPAEACWRGQSWRYDGVDFSVLHPDAGSSLQGNDRSCVLLVELGDYRFLLTGDIEEGAEHALLRTGDLQQVQMVTAPHHGSRTSSTVPFIQALQPDLVVVSAAFANRWGLPKPDVVERWRAVGSEVLNTAQSGAVELHVCTDRSRPEIRQYRQLNRRIWHE